MTGVVMLEVTHTDLSGSMPYAHQMVYGSRFQLNDTEHKLSRNSQIVDLTMKG